MTGFDGFRGTAWISPWFPGANTLCDPLDNPLYAHFPPAPPAGFIFCSGFNHLRTADYACTGTGAGRSNVIHKIKVAEFGPAAGATGPGRGPASKVMDTMWNLTDRYGPRLTNSPQFRAAGDWAVSQLKEWGLSNVHLEKWSTAEVPAGAIPGWEVTRYSGAMVEPSYMPIIGLPIAWTSGTNGPLTGEAILAPIVSPADVEKYRGKVKGRIVLTSVVPELALPTTPLATRYTPEQLADLTQELIPVPRTPGGGRGNNAVANMTSEERDLSRRNRQFLEGRRGPAHHRGNCARTGELLFGGGAPRRAIPQKIFRTCPSPRSITIELPGSYNTKSR